MWSCPKYTLSVAPRNYFRCLEPDSEVYAVIEGLAPRRGMMRIMASLMKATAVAARAS